MLMISFYEDFKTREVYDKILDILYSDWNIDNFI
jgi:hypothetical protein